VILLEDAINKSDSIVDKYLSSGVKPVSNERSMSKQAYYQIRKWSRALAYNNLLQNHNLKSIIKRG